MPLFYSLAENLRVLNIDIDSWQLTPAGEPRNVLIRKQFARKIAELQARFDIDITQRSLAIGELLFARKICQLNAENTLNTDEIQRQVALATTQGVMRTLESEGVHIGVNMQAAAGKSIEPYLCVELNKKTFIARADLETKVTRANISLPASDAGYDILSALRPTEFRPVNPADRVQYDDISDEQQQLYNSSVHTAEMHKALAEKFKQELLVLCGAFHVAVENKNPKELFDGIQEAVIKPLKKAEAIAANAAVKSAWDRLCAHLQVQLNKDKTVSQALEVGAKLNFDEKNALGSLQALFDSQQTSYDKFFKVRQVHRESIDNAHNKIRMAVANFAAICGGGQYTVVNGGNRYEYYTLGVQRKKLFTVTVGENLTIELEKDIIALGMSAGEDSYPDLLVITAELRRIVREKIAEPLQAKYKHEQAVAAIKQAAGQFKAQAQAIVEAVNSSQGWGFIGTQYTKHQAGFFGSDKRVATTGTLKQLKTNFEDVANAITRYEYESAPANEAALFSALKLLHEKLVERMSEYSSRRTPATQDQYNTLKRGLEACLGTFDKTKHEYKFAAGDIALPVASAAPSARGSVN